MMPKYLQDQLSIGIILLVIVAIIYFLLELLK